MSSQLRIVPIRACLNSHLSTSHTLIHLGTFARPLESHNPIRHLTTSASNLAKRRLAPITKSPPPSPTPSLTSPPSSRSSKNVNPNNQPTTVNEILSQRKLPLIGASIFALLLGIYISSLVTSSLKSKTPSPSPSTSPSSASSPSPQSHSHTSTISPAKFDSSLDFPERLGGITSLRRQLASRARGHVLEVAIGTGRNLPYYDWTEVVSPSNLSESERITRILKFRAGSSEHITELEKSTGGLEGEVLSYTGVDISPEMLLLARNRVRENVPGLDKVMRKRRAEPMPSEMPAAVVSAVEDRVRLILSDAERGPLPEEKQYDTVVQTFGLCSVDDPKRLIKNMCEVVKKDTGRILLLEHGRGWWEWMNGLLDRWAGEHHAKYGCWWNRDIEGIVREAEKEVEGLEVVSLKRPAWRQLGSVVLVEMRVRGKENEKKEQQEKEAGESGKSGEVPM